MIITRSTTASTAACLALTLTACAGPSDPIEDETVPAVTFSCGEAGALRVDRTENPDFAATWETLEDCAVTAWSDGERTDVENDVMSALGANVVGQTVPDEEALTPIYEMCATRSRVGPSWPANDLGWEERAELRKKLNAMVILCPDHPHRVTYASIRDWLGKAF